MIDRERLKRACLGLATRIPLYHLMPVGRFRDYAAIHYLHRTNPDGIVGYLKRSGRLPDWRASSMELAAGALVQSGNKEQAQGIMNRAMSQAPENAQPMLVLAEIAEAEGNLADALRYAKDAWLTAPTSLVAAQCCIRLSLELGSAEETDGLAVAAFRRFPLDQPIAQLCVKSCNTLSGIRQLQDIYNSRRALYRPKKAEHPAPEIKQLNAALNSLGANIAVKSMRFAHREGEPNDQNAITAIQKFPNNEAVLWTACKCCTSQAQFTAIQETWRPLIKKASSVSWGARPLALAALHVELYDVAMELYAEACMIELQGRGVGKPIADKSLEGKGGLVALRDLREALEGAGIPFFFAAGTALGIVRNGGPLDHDDDIDVGVLEDYWDRDKLAEIFTASPHFRIEPTVEHRPKLRLTHTLGAGIDIFRFYRDKGNFYHDGNFVRWRNSAFDIERKVSADGDIFYLPSNVDGYLTENYGDWRTPNSKFDAFVDGPNVEVTLPEYHAVHRMRRAYKYIRAMQLIDAHHELEAIKPSLIDLPVGRTLIREMQL